MPVTLMFLQFRLAEKSKLNFVGECDDRSFELSALFMIVGTHLFPGIRNIQVQGT